MHHLPTEREHDETDHADVKDDCSNMELAVTHVLGNRERGMNSSLGRESSVTLRHFLVAFVTPWIFAS